MDLNAAPSLTLGVLRGGNCDALVRQAARTLLLDLAMKIDSDSALTLLGLVTSQTGTGLPLSLVKILSFVHKILLGAPLFWGLSLSLIHISEPTRPY